MAGRRAEGVIQATLATVGAAMTVPWLLEFTGRWARDGAFPLDQGPQFPWAVTGLAVFGVAWAWSLHTALVVLRAARQRP